MSLEAVSKRIEVSWASSTDEWLPILHFQLSLPNLGAAAGQACPFAAELLVSLRFALPGTEDS
jgi:hypothetical protein